MDDELRDEIEAARKRRAQGERKAARREMDALTIATEKAHFWSRLLGLLRTSATEVSNSLALNRGIEFDERDNEAWIRTLVFPVCEAYVRFQDRTNDVYLRVHEQKHSDSDKRVLLDDRLRFVCEDGECMLEVRDEVMDVHKTKNYIMKHIVRSIHENS